MEWASYPNELGLAAPLKRQEKTHIATGITESILMIGRIPLNFAEERAMAAETGLKPASTKRRFSPA
jgi:hypothetical protein